MRLLNRTKKTTLSDDCKIVHSFMDRALGLLDPRNPRALIFITRWGIHTFFLGIPIDIILLDDSWRVVKISASLNPFSFFIYKPVYRIVVELPRGSIARSRTSLGDKIFLG